MRADIDTAAISRMCGWNLLAHPPIVQPSIFRKVFARTPATPRTAWRPFRCIAGWSAFDATFASTVQPLDGLGGSRGFVKTARHGGWTLMPLGSINHTIAQPGLRVQPSLRLWRIVYGESY
jgi:hypothetical protein